MISTLIRLGIGMIIMKNQSRQENLAYLVTWSLLFATPVLNLYLRTTNDPYMEFNWGEVFFVWGRFSIFLILFLIHNFLLAPLLIHQNKRKLYASIMTALIAVFIVFQCTNRPNFGKREGFRPHKMEQREDFPPKFEEFEEFRKHEPRNEGPRMGRRHTPPLFVGEHDVLSIAVLLLMFGANLGTKYYFRSRRDQRKLEDLEKQNLEQQLEYLKYQINPHFFMNTLNNIHALVDIDPSKAQETIRELSKMMRFVLYEGDKSGVPLTKEFEFIRNYTKLMQLRYSDKVKITIDVPEEAPDVTIPPLMLISFIENAFKHGISYQHDSFIDIKLEISNSASNLLFTCRNSKAEKPNQEKGGVGLANVKKRLDLLYDKSYTLDIKDEPDIYIVELKIPLR